MLDTHNTRGRLLADRGYDAQGNRELLERHRLRDGIPRRGKPGQQARQRLDARNRAINKTRAQVEHVFAGLEQLGGKVGRAMTLANPWFQAWQGTEAPSRARSLSCRRNIS